MEVRFRVSGRAVIIREGCILLNKLMHGGYYNFPGGGVFEGETLEECTKREIFEETGFTVDVKDALFTLYDEPVRCGYSGPPHLSMFFRCEIDEGAPVAHISQPDYTPGTDIAATLEWVGLNKLREIPFIPYIPRQIEEYMKTGSFKPCFLSGYPTGEGIRYD